MASINRPGLVWLLIVAALLVCCEGAQAVSKPPASPKLIVGKKHVPPFVIKRPDGSWDGISIELWGQITHELNLDYEIREVVVQLFATMYYNKVFAGFRKMICGST